ncbi:MAG: hypothetical protein C3F11_03865 [Methylocystaceae bacterium]|nr:MAG: hypothetical protein C3F11_03865 [Methylocystaceae bacterium]
MRTLPKEVNLLRRWSILSIFALLAVLANGMDGVRLDKASHACAGMSAGAALDDCHRSHASDNSAPIPDCAVIVCATSQTALPAHEALPPTTLAVSALSTQPAPHDDARLRDLRGPPDLRPPIA